MVWLGLYHKRRMWGVSLRLVSQDTCFLSKFTPDHIWSQIWSNNVQRPTIQDIRVYFIVLDYIDHISVIVSTAFHAIELVPPEKKAHTM